MALAMSRRDVLKLILVSGAASAAVPVVGGEAAADPESQIDGVVGEVAVIGSRTLTVLAQGSEVAIAPTATARMYSGSLGVVASLASFVVGDRIAAQGLWRNDVFVASSIGSIFTTFSATVNAISSDGSTFETSSGSIDVRAGSLPFPTSETSSTRQELKQILSGQVITGLEWRHPQTGERYLLMMV